MLGYFKIKKDIIEVLCYSYSHKGSISEKNRSYYNPCTGRSRARKAVVGRYQFKRKKTSV